MLVIQVIYILLFPNMAKSSKKKVSKMVLSLTFRRLQSITSCPNRRDKTPPCLPHYCSEIRKNTK